MAEKWLPNPSLVKDLLYIKILSCNAVMCKVYVLSSLRESFSQRVLKLTNFFFHNNHSDNYNGN